MNRTRVLRVGRKAVARQGGKGESPKGREENGQGAWGFPFEKQAALENTLVPWIELSGSLNKLGHSKSHPAKPIYNPQQTKL